ncbi:hypothetical protein EJB05_35663, partial [Eragrostis curvula]
MDVGVIALSLVVGSFGVASAVLGFIADAKRLTWYDIDIDIYEGVCWYPPNAAFVLALVAVPLLVVAQIVASFAGGCCGCCRPQHGASKSRRVVGIIAAVLSWIATFLAGGLYLNGVVWNAPVTREIDTWCRLLGPGYFRLPALLSLAAMVLAILSYIMISARAPESRPSTAAPVPAAKTSQPKPDVPQEPPVGEAVEVPRHSGLRMDMIKGKSSSQRSLIVRVDL